MPPCRECDQLVDGECSASEVAPRTLGRELPPPPLGACFVPIVESYLDLISAGMRVLEIGCGTWSRVKDHADAVGAVYEGIDAAPEYFGRPVIATRIENLADLSLADESFDVVVGSQTMEHWPENGCPLDRGLHQCFRVCREGGSVLLNVPIHFHGSREFMLGRLDRIEALFARFSGQVSYEEWGRPSDPLPPCRPWPGYRALADRPAFILAIHAVRDRAPPEIPRRRRPGGRLGQILTKPTGFVLHRLLYRLSFSRH